METLKSLDNIDYNIIETLFYYKLTDKEEYQMESGKLAKEYKFNNEGVKTNSVAYKLKRKPDKRNKRSDF